MASSSDFKNIRVYYPEGAKIDVYRPVLLNERCGLLQVREMVQF